MSKIRQFYREIPHPLALVIQAVLIAAFVFSHLPSNAFANKDQQKLYKEAFDAPKKPKCIHCHVDKLPKKDDGKHALNEYGQQLVGVKEAPDVDTYKQVGPGEEMDASGGEE